MLGYCGSGMVDLRGVVCVSASLRLARRAARDIVGNDAGEFFASLLLASGGMSSPFWGIVGSGLDEDDDGVDDDDDGVFIEAVSPGNGMGPSHSIGRPYISASSERLASIDRYSGLLCSWIL